jgi:hypothetical protein
VTRRRKNVVYEVLHDFPLPAKAEAVISEEYIILGYQSGNQVEARLIKYKEPVPKEKYEFVTNNYRMKVLIIATLYKRRWQIELLFKRMKQTYPLKYFSGDSENAIKTQIWCTLIADLLLKIVKKGAAATWSFSNLASTPKNRNNSLPDQDTGLLLYFPIAIGSQFFSGQQCCYFQAGSFASS